MSGILLNLLSIGSTMTYSSAYSTAIDWMRTMVGMSDLGGASSLTCVEAGVILSMNAHSTWVCTLNAPMAPLHWTR